MNKHFENFEKHADNFEQQAAQVYNEMKKDLESQTPKEVQKLINRHGESPSTLTNLFKWN